jgi:hypothetical protein
MNGEEEERRDYIGGGIGRKETTGKTEMWIGG